MGLKNGAALVAAWKAGAGDFFVCLGLVVRILPEDLLDSEVLGYDSAMDYSDILRELTERGARFAVAGGFASLAHGVVRVTMDLDLLVDVQDDNLEVLWDSLSGLGFSTQQPIPRASGVSAEALLHLAESKGMKALSWSHGSQPFLVVDLLVGPPFRWDSRWFERSRLFGIDVLILRKEELIRLKRLSGRDKDLKDVEELERLQD